MKIACIKDHKTDEKRVALVPDVAKKLIAKGFSVSIETDAGLESGYPNEEYVAAGCKVEPKAETVLKKADVLCTLSRPTPETIKTLNTGASVIGMLNPSDQPKPLQDLSQLGVDLFALELIPRITRAQAMDVLSSQANLAGYRAVIEAAQTHNGVFPLMMTAAGTVPALRVFVMGAGVAGLQAIATAKRLGAIVTATDVRPATKTDVMSLGAKFIAVEDEEFQNAQTAGGYAKPMSEEYQAKQRQLLSEHLTKQDIVITTALIPGKPAPKLITKDMIKAMKKGAVIVDMAAERGGNVEGTKPEEIAIIEGIKVVGFTDLASRTAQSASKLYANNILKFIELLYPDGAETKTKNLADEIITATHLAAVSAPTNKNTSSDMEKGKKP